MSTAIPFPQANNLDIILDLINNFPETGFVPEMVANRLNYEIREGQYYLSALHYIGAAICKNSIYYISEPAKRIKIESSTRLKNIFLASLIFENKILCEMYRHAEELTDSKERISFFAIFIEVNLHYNEVTATRRASTVNAWFNWIDSNLET